MKHTQKFFIVGLVSILSFVFFMWPVTATFTTPDNYYDILNQKDDTIVITDDIDDPLADGSYQIASTVKGLYMKWGKITTFLDAQNAALAYAQNLINRTLLIVWTVALVYLLYTGFQMVTAAGDETKFKERTKKTRAALIALLWIGLSAIFINFVLYVIDRIV